MLPDGPLLALPAGMAELRIRNPKGDEQGITRSQLARAVRRGDVTADWEVFHCGAGCWLPISVHPAWRQAHAAPAEPPERSAELVLIYPETPVPPSAPPRARGDDLGSLPLLTAEEIERVLHPRPRRESAPVARPSMQSPVPSTSDLAEALLRTARDQLPTFTRAVSAAAGLMAQRG